MADEAECREWKRLCDKDVFDDGEGDAEEVPKDEGGHAHDPRGSSQGGELAGGKAEHDLLAVVVDLFGDSRFECHFGYPPSRYAAPQMRLESCWVPTRVTMMAMEYTAEIVSSPTTVSATEKLPLFKTVPMMPGNSCTTR